MGKPSPTLITQSSAPVSVTKLKAKVYSCTSQIPVGRVSTYGDIASALGNRRLSRAVGTILSVNPTPIVVPCHRVVHKDGRIGGYSAPKGYREKIRLLRSEGVEVDSHKVKNLEDILFKEFRAL